MFNAMNENEIKIATKLINHGLSKAAGSLGQVLNSPIDIKAIDFSIVHLKDVPQFCHKSGERIHILNTKLIGELKGISHLILSEAEVNKIHKACLPQSILDSDNAESNTLKTELLTEIDNIVAASAITEFANFLDLRMHGGVPSLKVMPADEVNSYIQEGSATLSSMIQFKAYIHGPELDIIPDFVWLIEEKFTNKIQDFAESADVEKLDNLKNI